MIEIVGPDHAEVLAAIHAGAFPAEAAWNSAAFASLLATPGTIGLLDPRGGLLLARAAADEAEVLTLAVDALQQRRGIGRALLRHAGAMLSEAGVTALFLDVADGNHAARALYASQGFAEVGRRRAYYGEEDALLLRLRIGPEPHG